jgi:predicted AAA+ superfamily ATPase
MLPFSFAELLASRRLHVTRAGVHTASRGRLLRAFDDYLAHGGFPEVVARDSALERRQLLSSYYQTTYYRDLVERHGLRSGPLLELLMRYCLDTYGDLLSVSAFAQRLKAHGLAGSKRTVSS